MSDVSSRSMRWWAGLLVLPALALAGCAGGGEEAAGTAVAGTEATTASVEASTEAEGDPSRPSEGAARAADDPGLAPGLVSSVTTDAVTYYLRLPLGWDSNTEQTDGMAGSAPDGESVIQAGARDVGLDEFMAAYQESATSAESSRRDVDFPGAERALELDLTTSDGERSIALVADSGAGTTVFWAYQAPELDPAVVDYLRAGNIGFGTPPAPGFTRLRQTSAAVGAGFDALLADVPEGFALDGFQAGTSVTYRRGAVDSGPADGEVVELRILGGTGSGVSELPEAVDLLLQELARNGAEDVTPQPGQVAGADDAVLLRSAEVEGPEGAAFSQWTVLVQAPSGAIFLMRYAAPVADFDEGLAAELVDSLQIESS